MVHCQIVLYQVYANFKQFPHKRLEEISFKNDTCLGDKFSTLDILVFDS